jgi:methylenetetrahydrofolate dehydrogenase (NADP+)/methenyltetrahydrofolate cyclohydrolase
VYQKIAPSKNVEGLTFDMDIDPPYPEILPHVCKELIESACAIQNKSISDLTGVMIGNSALVGRPIHKMMKSMLKEAFITDKTALNIDMIKKADIVVCGTRSPRLLKGDMVKEGSILIDIGINDLPPSLGTLAGDIDFVDCV